MKKVKKVGERRKKQRAKNNKGINNNKILMAS
jgi:hypothetical protein